MNHTVSRRRRRNRSRRGRAFVPARRYWTYVDETVLNFSDAGTDDYKTTDVRFNTERPFKIMWVRGSLTSTTGAVAQIAILDPNIDSSGAGIQGMIASTGLITVGQNTKNFIVRNQPSTDFIAPSGPEAVLVRVSNIMKGTKFNGCLRVGILLADETFPPISYKVLGNVSPDSDLSAFAVLNI